MSSISVKRSVCITLVIIHTARARKNVSEKKKDNLKADEFLANNCHMQDARQLDPVKFWPEAER